ncbi:SGNH/GDSL hydrolase family protein [Mucilaginibacter ximonensis]|uniref:SGNH/GDSL hydrolase family protein n=1 Tax=Mucilaginibacter ximonensis TaxID=538021 RepID=A0ABW5YG74_9SPHI
MKKFAVLFVLAGMLAAFAPQQQKNWMAIGDSITFLNDKPNLTKNRITKGYMDRVVEKLPYMHFANKSYPGLTIKGIADNINNLGLEKADFYSVFLGTNDWWTNLPIGKYDDYKNATGNGTAYGSYRTVINKIKSLNNHAVIILITPFQRADYVDINNIHSFIHGSYSANNSGVMLSAYADAIIDIAKREHFELVDLYHKSGVTSANAVNFKRLRDPKTGEYKDYKYPDYINIPFNPTDTTQYPYPVEAMNWCYDGLHPSDKGHQRIADMLVNIMKKY